MEFILLDPSHPSKIDCINARYSGPVFRNKIGSECHISYPQKATAILLLETLKLKAIQLAKGQKRLCKNRQCMCHVNVCRSTDD